MNDGKMCFLSSKPKRNSFWPNNRDSPVLTEAIIVTVELVLGGILLCLLFLLLVDPESGDNAIEEVAEIDQNDRQENGHPPSPTEHAKSWNNESRAEVGDEVGCDIEMKRRRGRAESMSEIRRRQVIGTGQFICIFCSHHNNIGTYQ